MLTGDKLRILRTASKFTQLHLGSMAGVSQTAIAEFEVGKRELRTGTVIKLMDALGVKVKWMVGEVEVSGP